MVSFGIFTAWLPLLRRLRKTIYTSIALFFYPLYFFHINKFRKIQSPVLSVYSRICRSIYPLVFPFIHISVHLPTCLSIHPHFCSFTHVSFRSSTFLFIYPRVFPFMHISVHLPTCLSIHPPTVHLHTCLSIHPPVCPFNSLSVIKKKFLKK